eukprot:TRINITY_DN16628_c0_g1_i4.p1 TRINITY_DN16628_c0_g1~~TRINITY_DN16628_c0_g1_i4.p1  ORF type:complete len:100 (-),score=12.29 TRINITY_DN16628_c0_g1_i4:197-496(-)
MQNFHISLADTFPNSANQGFISTDAVIKARARARVLGDGTCINVGFDTRASLMYATYHFYISQLTLNYPYYMSVVGGMQIICCSSECEESQQQNPFSII